MIDVHDMQPLDADPRPGTTALANTALGVLGIELLVAERDRVVARMPAPGHRTANGTLLVLAESVASTAAGLAVGPARRAFGAELDAALLGSASGTHVVATATPLVTGEALHTWRIEVVDGAGEAVLEGRCTLGIVDAP